MQWLPSPPTDNIYKLLAVFGLWLIAGALTLFSIFSYLDYRSQKETREESYHSQTERMVNSFTKRIRALEEGTPELHKIADLPDTFNNDITFLKNSLAMQEKNLSKYKQRKRDNLDTFMDYLLVHETEFYIFVGLYATLTSLCTVIGFSRWFQKIQKPSEVLNELDIRIKEASLLKLKIEISQLQPMSKTIEQLFELHFNKPIPEPSPPRKACS
ncbi:hypothetical protein [Pseudomonas sp. R5-89-07]|uniref:hypothetical protein n=1 Tax=Pseudomonas sp. R5-89-07 TaxID=658644 RepID=UPI000F586B34|nr:hypothetical protein [Pseudomonas sp. R5-89-07]AZF07763.1 hypothetical protein C4J94_5043 [Pseudomonas sp. R5-89-07]